MNPLFPQFARPVPRPRAGLPPGVASVRPSRAAHRAFTLIEMLLVVAILAILASLGLSVMAGAEERALENRTRAQIERISKVLDRKLEEYAWRVLPIRVARTTRPEEVRWVRDAAIEELLRVEFPTRQTDLLDTPPAFPFPFNEKAPPAPPNTTYDWSTFPDPQYLIRIRTKLRMPADGSSVGPDWSATHEGAECLYAILALLTLEDGQSALTILRENQYGDTDADGVNEVLDAFGDPMLVDLVDKQGKHIDPLYDRFPAFAPSLPAPATEYRLIIESPNLLGKLR